MKHLVSAVAVIAIATAGFAEGVSPDDVVYSEYGEVDVSLTGQRGDPAAGSEIMVNRGKGNCIACHQVTALEGDKDLIRVGAFVKVLDQTAFHDETNGNHHRNGEQNGKGHRPVDDGRSDVGTEPILDVGCLDLERIAQKIFFGFRQRFG